MQSYITRNARLEEAQAGIKIAGRNINNLRYADDTTLNRIFQARALEWVPLPSPEELCKPQQAVVNDVMERGQPRFC